MDLQQVTNLINEHIDLVEVNASALASSKDRAAKFLVIQAILATYLKGLEDGKAKLKTMVDATYAQSILGASGKNVTENKIIAEADPAYARVREGSEELDSEINWIKTHMKIFENAHILFRQFLRE